MGSEVELPPAVKRFVQEAALLGLAVDPVLLDDSARTAAEAAAGLGCQVAEIAKSIVFRRVEDRDAVLVVTSGDQRVDQTKLAELVGAVERAEADFVRVTTGFAIGGVPPLGHATEVLVFVDESLLRFGQVWAAAGHPHAVFAVDPGRLCEVLRTHAVHLAA